MTKIHRRLISFGQYPKCQDIARECGVSTKTIQRDVKFMKECWGLPISFNKSMRGYEYTESVMDFPAIKLTENEVFAFLVARKSIDRYEGTHIHEPLKALFEKIVLQMGSKQSTLMKRVDEYVSFRSSGWTRGKFKVLDDLSKACRDRREISFDYKSPHKGLQRKKRKRPIRLVNHDNAWYLLVIEDRPDSTLPGFRIHSVARLTRLKMHAVTFPEIDFNLEERMKYNFGIFHSEQNFKVKVVFDAFAAPIIKERKYNDSQRIKDRKDGGIEFSIIVNDLTEIKAWILNWGKHAQVVSPKSLVNDFLDELKMIKDKYSKKRRT